MGSENSQTATGAERRILIIDSQPLFRRGLAALIDGEPDLAVCASVSTQGEGLEAIASSNPDLVIAELYLGQADGLSLLSSISSQYPHLPVLVLSMNDRPGYASRALQAGAGAYLAKQEMSATLIRTIRQLRGETDLSPRAAAQSREL